MTEFLIFLAMCAVFSLLFWRFLKIPNTEQRHKAQAAKEYKELHARVAAEVAAERQGFGRKAAAPPAQTFVPSAGQFPMDSFGGSDLSTPLGHDPANPDSRIIPKAFQGEWLWEGASENVEGHRLSLRADSLIDALGAQPVVGTYNISDSEIAIVTQNMEDGRWLFATFLVKLLDGGTKLTDLENMDMRWNRLS